MSALYRSPARGYVWKRKYTDLAQLSATVIELLPKLNSQEQRISLGLYRLLARRHGFRGAPLWPS